MGQRKCLVRTYSSTDLALLYRAPKVLVRRRRRDDVREQRGTSLIQGGKATGGRTEDGTRWAGWYGMGGGSGGKHDQQM